MKKFKINFSETITYREKIIEARTKQEAEELYQNLDLEKEVGISDVETEFYSITEGE